MSLSFEHIPWGLEMTVVGMGLVFAMLAMLWGVLTLVLALDKEANPSAAAISAPAPVAAQIDTAAETPAVDAVQGPPIINGMPADLVAAIMIATMKHRQNLRRQAAPIMRTNWPGSQSYASRWVAIGRARQNNSWQPKGR